MIEVHCDEKYTYELLKKLKCVVNGEAMEQAKKSYASRVLFSELLDCLIEFYESKSS